MPATGEPVDRKPIPEEYCLFIFNHRKEALDPIHTVATG